MNATPPNGLSPSDAERLDDLLADRAVFGLDAAEENELSILLAAAERTGDDGLDLLAAQVVTATIPDTEHEAPPSTVRERLLAPTPRVDVAAASPTADRSGRGPLIALALAAALMLAFFVSNPGQALSPAESRTRLLAQADDAIELTWNAQDDPSVAGKPANHAWGSVVWSDDRQEGYLAFRGLAANDPSVEQYQLWVFDEARNAEYPVDGGVFDVPATDDPNAEFVVAIDPKLPVTKATLFAITVEQPGGVVVSDRSRLPLLAQR